MVDWKQISNRISDAIHSRFTFARVAQLGGGDSNQAWKLSGTTETNRQRHEVHFFVKLNAANRESMFAAESAGLAAMAATHSVHTPCVITQGLSDQYSFLVLEYLDLKSHGKSSLLGSQLAAMHRNHTAQFGWSMDNTIGVTPQHNSWCADWLTFWREQRLEYQLELAAHNGYRGKLQEQGRNVIAALPDLLADHNPAPSLLHGDLWGGNHAYLADGTPVIFDPASYYGDREADIAMTELFGGFDAGFYAAYQAAYPLNAGYDKRKTLYNLYHILNHCNMVSGGYVSQAERMMQNLLGQTR